MTTTPDGKNTEQVSVDLLSLDPANARLHPQRNIDSIIASLRRFGQQKPIVVTRAGVVIAGNGLLEAARQLGWPDVTVRWSELSGTEATAYGIADNRTAELSEWDSVMLKTIGDALAADGVDLTDVGFTADEINAMGGITVMPPSRETQSPEDVTEAYNTTDVRQIMLVMGREEYAAVLQDFAEVAKRYDLATNTDVVLKLLELWKATEEAGDVPTDSASTESI